MSATNRWWRDRDAECAAWVARLDEQSRRWWERVNDDVAIELPPLPTFMWVNGQPPSGRRFVAVDGRWVATTEVAP